jgi:hypothetical protein
VGRIVRDVRLFERLKEDPGWRRLVDVVQEKPERFLKALCRRQMAGEVVDQREIDYMRGWQDCLDYLVSTPELALEKLEQVAKTAYALATVEQLQAEEDESPYA